MECGARSGAGNCVVTGGTSGGGTTVRPSPLPDEASSPFLAGPWSAERAQLLERGRAHAGVDVAHLLQQHIALHARVTPALRRGGARADDGRASARLDGDRVGVVREPEPVDPLGARDAD